MPRQSPSAAAFPIQPGKRLQPPADFPPGSPERKFFQEVVASVPAAHFQLCDLGTLTAYVGAFIDMVTARGELKLSGNIIDGKPNPLIGIVRDLGRSVNVLGRSLRLNPISRVPLPTKQPPANLSYYEKQALAQEAERDGQSN